MDKKIYPIAYCPTCKRKEILNITNTIHKLRKTKVSVCTCGRCNTVLNLDGDIKIDYISEIQAEKMGWKVEKK